jgi:predicted Fe-Mo cluster-binding NifX family protein
MIAVKELRTIKIAIPLFGTRVSPRFDCAPQFLIVESAEGKVIEEEIYHTVGWTQRQRLKKIAELKIDTLICGGIDTYSGSLLRDQGVQIYSWVTAEAKDALRHFLNGELESGIMMDGRGCCRGRWRFRGRRESNM